MSASPRLRLVLGALAACIAGSCSSPSAPHPRTCTLMGCDSGLAVVLERRPAGPYRVELIPRGPWDTRSVYECAGTGPCFQTVFFQDFTGDWARVRVTTAEGTIEREVLPRYEESRPNGPDCPPVCRRATVTMPVPT